jgi:two-component system LytT family sensor kinase
MVFHFVIIDHEKGRMIYELEWYQLVFFANYVCANLLISYVLLPHFLYRKKYLEFGLYCVMIVVAVILIEEFVLEKLFFPDTRGSNFQGAILSLSEALSILGTLTGVKFAWDSIHRQREIDELKLIVKDSELSFLNSQINPHFLFNNLNNLYSYAIEQSPKTPEIILGLSGVLRYMLYECREPTVPLLKEIEQLRNFIQLYEIQIEDRGAVSFTTKNISNNYQIAPLILNVFVENAFKHSQSGQSEKIHISVSVDVSPSGELHFHCVNNYEPNTHPDGGSKGIGLENVKKRLALLYPNRHKLQIDDTENEFRVGLQIQLQTP